MITSECVCESEPWMNANVWYILW